MLRNAFNLFRRFVPALHNLNDAPRAVVPAPPRAGVPAPRVLRREGDRATGGSVSWGRKVHCRLIDLGVNDEGRTVVCFGCERSRSRCRCPRSQPTDTIHGFRVVVVSADTPLHVPPESTEAGHRRRSQRERRQRVEAIRHEAAAHADGPEFEAVADAFGEHEPQIEQADAPLRFVADELIEEDVIAEEAVAVRRNVRMLKVSFSI